MADNTENKTTATQKARTINDAPEAEQENVGEVSDTEQQTPQREEKSRAEFSPPDLGNEDNVSTWLVNMLSGRLWDFALNNMEWVGDLCDRAFYSRMERNAEKRQMALKVKEAQQRAATASQKKLTNEDGTINAGAAKSRSYDENGKLVGLDDYALKPGDKVVDAEGKPLQGKTPEEMKPSSASPAKMSLKKIKIRIKIKTAKKTKTRRKRRRKAKAVMDKQDPTTKTRIPKTTKTVLGKKRAPVKSVLRKKPPKRLAKLSKPRKSALNKGGLLPTKNAASPKTSKTRKAPKISF